MAALLRQLLAHLKTHFGAGRTLPFRARLLNEPPRGTSFFCFILFICVRARTPVPPCTTRDNDARDNSTDLALGGSDCCGDGDRRDGGSDDTFPLLDQLLEELPEVLERFVLPELDANDLPMLARAGGGWRSTVVSSNLPCAGSTAGSRLTLDAFICGSFHRLAWGQSRRHAACGVKVCRNAARLGRTP
jgi:hypothetical protein